MIVYQIKRADGLFSKGGQYPRFTKRGKLWRQVGHLKQHLRMYVWDGKREIPSDWVVIKYEDGVETEMDPRDFL